MIAGGQQLYTHQDEAFPRLNKQLDIIFDLNGAISRHCKSITSTLVQSGVVIVPICNDKKTIEASLYTLSEILHFNQNVIVVATKLKVRNEHDIFYDWDDCEDMRAIKQAVHSHINKKIPILPLQYSEIFEQIFEDKLPISQLIKKA